VGDRPRSVARVTRLKSRSAPLIQILSIGSQREEFQNELPQMARAIFNHRGASAGAASSTISQLGRSSAALAVSRWYTSASAFTKKDRLRRARSRRSPAPPSRYSLLHSSGSADARRSGWISSARLIFSPHAHAELSFPGTIAAAARRVAHRASLNCARPLGHRG
jgi:hypothetical protein